MSNDPDLTLRDGDTIPTVPELVASQLEELNAQANPIGHTVIHDGEHFRAQPTGVTEVRECCVSSDPEAIHQYLRLRQAGTGWSLDLNDHSISVTGTPSTESVTVTDLASGASAVVNGWIGGCQTRDADGQTAHTITSVLVAGDDPPSVGRWYR
ncbi:hypothetical protein ND991_03675 [Gordonia sputi]|uniref:hypothetical protein n=1 Tax=Gordonia sputi TaxID=36823 RepID=UPI002042CF39|nr:hypothetical protein [Gordonia sputi]MCM3894319.1 hypothetical protein [Gordonia sputi]